MTAHAVLIGLLTGLAACAPEPAPEPAPPPSHGWAPAPHVAVPTADGPVDLTTLAGSPVVIQFAPAGDAAWAALDDALQDLEAAGATVLAVTVDGAEAEAAAAFGYAGVPLAVVVDGEGTVRGRTRPASGDALFAMAGPVLAEADVARTVEWRGAETLDALVQAGGVVVAAHEEPAPVAHALRVDSDLFSAQDLPADLGTPLAFVGHGAAVRAASAAGWGYVSVFVADDAGALTPVVGELPRGLDRPQRPRGVRG